MRSNAVVAGPAKTGRFRYVRGLVLAVLLLYGFAASAVASAAPPWSAPQTISSPALFIDDPRLAFSSNGSALASWRWQNGIGNKATSGSGLPPVPSARRSSAPSELRRTSSRARSCTEEAGRMGAVQRDVGLPARAAARGCRPCSVAPTASSSDDSPFASVLRSLARASPPTPVGTPRSPGSRIAASGPTASTSHCGVREGASAGRSDWRPGASATSRSRSGRAATCWSRGMRAAWYEPGSRTRPASPSTARTRSVPKTPIYANLRTLVALNSRAVVAWGSQLLTEGGDTGPVRFQAAVRPSEFAALPRRRSCSSSQAAGRRARGSGSRPIPPAASSSHGPGGTARTTACGFQPPMRVAGSARRRRSRQPASMRRSRRRDVRGRRRARGLAPGARRRHSAQVLASYRPSPNGAFGAPEQLAESAFADSPSAAFDPTTQRPSVVWRSRDRSGPGIPLAEVKTYVRFVTRAP